MNFAIKFLLLLFSFSSPLFCQQIPLRKSGNITINTLQIPELPEAHSLESCATETSSTENSVAGSPKITPINSVSPCRRDSADAELDEILSEEKIFQKVRNSTSPESKKILLTVIEARLNQLCERTNSEKEKCLRQERINSPKPYYFDWPGSSSKAYTLIELTKAEEEAMPFVLVNSNYP